ncbi:MAG: DUF4136 domain-containing protein [Cytophagaceae bacterium]
MDKSTDLGSYKTYSWKEPEVKTENPVYTSDLIDQNIRENVEKELALKGMVHNDQNPDIYVQYHTYTQTLQQTSSVLYGYPAYTGYSSMYGPMGYGGFGSSYGYGYMGSSWGYGGYYMPSNYTTTQETLVLDFIDAKTNKLVWRGSIDEDVTNTSHIDKQMEKGVHSIMKKFPESGNGTMVKHHG